MKLLQPEYDCITAELKQLYCIYQIYVGTICVALNKTELCSSSS